MPVRATITLVKPYAGISHVAIAATDIKLRTGLFEKFFTEEVTLSEVAAILISKSFANGVGIAEASFVDLTKVLANNFAMADADTRTVVWSRAFTDAVTLDDVAQAGDIDANKTNFTTLNDVIGFAQSKALTSSFSFADALAVNVASVLADSISFADDLSTTNVWSKSHGHSIGFSDAQAFAQTRILTSAFALDDATQVDKNYGSTKGNVVQFSEDVSISRTHGKALGNMAFNTLTLN